MIGIKPDKDGWMSVNELIAGIRARSYQFDRSNEPDKFNEFDKFDEKILKNNVQNDEIKRYSFNEDESMIRANKEEPAETQPSEES